MPKFMMTALIASSMGYGFYRMRVPAGLLVGSLIGAALYNIFTGVAWMPSEAKVIAQIMAGTFIACSLDGNALRRMPHLMRPGLMIVFGMLIVNLVTGFLVFFLTPLDLITALMGTVPGGMSDVPLISADLGADLPKVAVMQFSRLLVAVGIYPSFIKLWHAKDSKNQVNQPKQVTASKEQPCPLHLVIFTMVVAILAGFVGKDMGVPAGPLVFSMLAILALRFLGFKVCMPKNLKRLAQILSGAYIGSAVGVSDLIEMRHLLAPILISNLGYLILCVLMGHWLVKQFDMPLSEAMLATTPGGSSDMVLIASELGVDSREVLVFQMMRLMMVVTIFPVIIKIIVNIFGG